MGVKVNKGMDPFADPRSVPRDRWDELAMTRRNHCHSSIPRDCRMLLRLVADVENSEWLGFGSREKYMRDGLGLDPVAVDLAIEFLRAGHYEVPVEFADAIAGGRKLRSGPGRPKAEEANGSDDNHSSDPIGRGSDYALARLERDRPELAEKVKAGELSANAAAVEAGFRKKPTALSQLRAAWRRATQDERETFISEVA